MPSPKGTNHEGLYLPASWATKGGVASSYYRMALDSAANLKPRASSPSRRTRPVSFEEMYGVRIGPRGETIALDQHDPQRDGPLLFDRDPPPQHLVTTTDEPVDHEGYPVNRAPPFGKFDEPRRDREEPMEPHRMATDPPTSARQERAMRAAEHGTGKLGIPPHVAREFLGDDDPQVPATPSTISQGQQGGDQHEDQPEDERLIRRILTKLGFKESDIDEAIARDRVGRRQIAGDAALSRRSFYATYPEARGLTDGLPAFAPTVFVHRSRGP
jgi:hypothetical protein